jgi:hypothetical protein
MKKQTSVQWLFRKTLEITLELENKKISHRNWEFHMVMLLEQAKDMEKEQILNAFWNGDNSDCNDEQYSKQIAEYYYNETYLNR